jgi:hypothetical protein
MGRGMSPMLDERCSIKTDRLRSFSIIYFVDIDECSAMTSNCDANAECENTVGSFKCTCNPGFTGNGVTCTGAYNSVNLI